MKRTKKYRTYISLAVQVAISYMHFVSIARSHCYPRLSGYRYHSPVPGEKKDIDPEHVLMPFLKCRFRIEKGTGAIRGSLNRMLDCFQWDGFRDREKSRKIKERRPHNWSWNAIYASCWLMLMCKGRRFDLLVQVTKIYGTVVVPLQKIVDELRWDWRCRLQRENLASKAGISNLLKVVWYVFSSVSSKGFSVWSVSMSRKM